MYNISRRSGFLKKRYFSLIGIITLTLVASNYNDTLAAELPIESQNNIVENSRDEVKKQQITISTELIQGIMNGENFDSSEFKNQIDIGYEFTNSNSLNAINADEAYYHGYTGKGVTVGVIEAGYADKRNVDLDNNRIKYNMNADENITHVLHPHATFIVGIIGAEKNGDNNTINKMGSQKNMHGVAYNSTVYSYAVGEKGTVGTTNDDEDAPYHIAEQSKDINLACFKTSHFGVTIALKQHKTTPTYSV